MYDFFKKLFGRKPASSTPLSDFVNASSREKKKVYDVAMKRAADAQRKVVERHRACA